MVSHLISSPKRSFLNLCIQGQKALELMKEREVVCCRVENQKEDHVNNFISFFICCIIHAFGAFQLL